MFAYETAVNVFFRLLNFTLLIGFLWYCIRHYVLPGVYQKITDQQEFENNLMRRQAEVQQELQRIEQSLRTQQQTRQELLAKVVQWNVAYKQVLAAQEQDRSHCKQHLLQLTTRKNNQIEQQRIASLVMPQALDRAQHDLTVYFADEQHGQEFLQEMVAYMHKDGQ